MKMKNWSSGSARLPLALLPTLRDSDTLVLTLYIRSGQTDVVADAEKEGRAIMADVEDDYSFQDLPEVKSAMDCTYQLE
jgi:hypothetical protein